ncbi:hypothetical protein RSK20926_11774 [Roseobacter sp. SK209-2-6]|uniref:phage head completion protein n=1 Tax=Roseobacter sp. SK209-2-6 TaxID=388739 RepID=UPI0000F3C6F8|nr:hypothetical protein RSK20926_11774 [Roseobacter sp. SK209-2-6]
MRGSLGGLKLHVSFDAPAEVPDGAGGFGSGWAQRFTCRAEPIYSSGGEVLNASRLQGKAAYKIRIHQSAMAKLIETNWRMRDLRRGAQDGEFPGAQFNIIEVDPISDRRWVCLAVESEAKT